MVHEVFTQVSIYGLGQVGLGGLRVQGKSVALSFSLV